MDGQEKDAVEKNVKLKTKTKSKSKSKSKPKTKPKTEKVFEAYNVLPKTSAHMCVARKKPNKKSAIVKYIGGGNTNRTSDDKLRILEEKNNWGRIADDQWVDLSDFYMCG